MTAQPIPSLKAGTELRSFEVEPDTSYLRGHPERIYRLILWGRGVDCICNGERRMGWERDEATAYALGEEWVRTGIQPCHQGKSYGLQEAVA